MVHEVSEGIALDLPAECAANLLATTFEGLEVVLASTETVLNADSLVSSTSSPSSSSWEREHTLFAWGTLRGGGTR